MNRAARRKEEAMRRGCYHEFAIDQVDWDEIPDAEVVAGLANLVERGFLIKTERGTYRSSIPKGSGCEKAKALLRDFRNLTSAGKAVYAATVTKEGNRLLREIMARTSGATLKQVSILAHRIVSAYGGDTAAAADDVRRGLVSFEVRPGKIRTH